MLPKRAMNILQERAKGRKAEVQRAYEVEAKLSKKMSDFERGYEIDPEEIDQRTNFQRIQDKNYMMSKMRAKLDKLFGGDGDEIDSFVDYFVTNNVSIQDFNSVYNQLLQMGEPNMNTAGDMIVKMNNLLDSGSNKPTKDLSVMIASLLQTIQNAYDKGQISEKKGDELTDKLESLSSVTPRKVLDDLESVASSNESEIDKAIEIDRALRPVKKTTKKGRPVGSKNKKSQSQEI